jgi:hypothetical protein
LFLQKLFRFGVGIASCHLHEASTGDAWLIARSIATGAVLTAL